jgi:hypothetical protein
MEENREIKIAVLIERMENIKDQFKRFSSHFDSEERATILISKRIDQHDLTIRQHWDVLTKLDRILFNDGKGLIFKVDRLERMHENRNWTFGTIVSVISLLISILTVIVMIQK